MVLARSLSISYSHLTIFDEKHLVAQGGFLTIESTKTSGSSTVWLSAHTIHKAPGRLLCCLLFSATKQERNPFPRKFHFFTCGRFIGRRVRFFTRKKTTRRVLSSQRKTNYFRRNWAAKNLNSQENARKSFTLTATQ